MIVMIVLGGIVFNMYHGPAFAAIHNRTPPMMRATATAVAIFLSAFVGLGMGPLLAGLLSDILMNTMYAGPGSFATSCGHQALARSEERGVGKEGGRTCRAWWSPKS